MCCHVLNRTSEYVSRALKIFKEDLHEWITGGTNFQNIIDVEKGY